MPMVVTAVTAGSDDESAVGRARADGAAPAKAPAAKAKSKKAKKHGKRKKEPVLLRFEDEQLGQIDDRASALGLSRAAWVRMVVAQALAREHHP